MRNKAIFNLASLFFLIISFFPLGSPAKSEGASSYQKLLKRFHVKSEELSIYATRSNGADDHLLVDNKAHTAMVPASVMKILVSSAVLGEFKSGHQFVTRLMSAGKIQKDSLVGDLYLVGGGDPSFVSEKLWYLVNVFLRSGIKQIDGDVVVDDTLFDQERFDSTRIDVRVDNAFDAPVGAMSFNWNSVNLFVRPGPIGDKAIVFVDPLNDYIRLVSKAKTSPGIENKLVASRVEAKGFPGDLVIVDGEIGAKSGEIKIHRNITQPDIWSGYNLVAFLEQRGIHTKGLVRAGKVPDGAVLLGSVESKPIEQILEDMNVYSNNYVAEMLTKNLGALRSSQASLKDGVQVIVEHVKSIGVPSDEIRMVNPSGLSRENRLSAYALWKVLTRLRKDFRVSSEFTSSLPIAGLEGTLRRRFVGTSGESWVRAKTGSINGVVSIAGYAGKPNGQIMTFAFLYNGGREEAKIRDFFDELILELMALP